MSFAWYATLSALQLSAFGMHLPLEWCETLTIIAPRSIGYTGFDETYDQDWRVYDIAFFKQWRALGFIVS